MYQMLQKGAYAKLMIEGESMDTGPEKDDS